LLDQATELEALAGTIQADQASGVTEQEIQRVRAEYQAWYAQCLPVLPDDLREKFRREYEGSSFFPKIKHFLVEPTKPSLWIAKRDGEQAGAQALSYWQYPYARSFLAPFVEQQSLLRQAMFRVSGAAASARDAVFVVHGRNESARNAVVAVLRAAGLKPLEFEQARRLTGQAAPYIGTILDAAFANAQAVVVLFTDDERVKLRNELAGPTDPKNLEFQPRPNVIFEAGMALGLHPHRTVIVEIGRMRSISDLAGRHIVRWDGSVESRKRLLQRLQDAGCSVDLTGEDWMTVNV
jgi:predicted nucleotide-binding protein